MPVLLLTRFPSDDPVLFGVGSLPLMMARFTSMRTDIDEIVSKVERDGVCVVEDFIATDLLGRIRTRVDELNQSERRDEVAFLESGGVNQRVFNLVNKGEIFEEIV